MSDVESEGGDKLSGLLAGDLLLLDQLHHGSDSWVGSCLAHGIEDEVLPGLLLKLFLFVGRRRLPV